MDLRQLQEKQAPLKDNYRAEPAAARITLHAKGTLDDEDIVCSIDTGRALVAAGLHPATGGDEFHACSGDLLLQALAGCAGVTLRSVATSMELSVSGTVDVEGDLDFRGTLGMDKEVAVGFLAIRMAFNLQSDATEDQLDTLIRLTERYCVVLQTITGGVSVEVSRPVTA